MRKDLNRWQKGIIGIDGEGKTDEHGRHHYTLLATSQGSYIESAHLSTVQCLEFLLSLPQEQLIVGYSLSYDWTKILQDIPDKILHQIGQSEYVDWGPYTIKYTPSRDTFIKHRNGRKIHIYDVFGFFQTKFTTALKEWKIADIEEIQIIENMKQQRGNFQRIDNDTIREYCFSECKQLVLLIRRLIETFVRADISVQHYYGAGAIAAAIMKKYRVKEYIKKEPETLHDPIMRGYFGGRFETRFSGNFSGVYSYDIRSAYPHILRTLPCLQHAEWRIVDTYNPDLQHALWAIHWRVPESSPWPPFPLRNNAHRIEYPCVGAGWYWNKEVQAAMEMFPDECFRITKGIAIVSKCEHTPFGFVNDLYAYRAQLRALGDMAHYTVKLGLNSLYGKTAQSVGKRPPYQCFPWAGMITSGTRAMLLRAIAQNPHAVLQVATDGILSTDKLDLPLGTELGEWEYSQYAQTFLVQPGIYELQSMDGKTTYRTRGFSSGRQDGTATPFANEFERLKQAYYDSPLYGQFDYSKERFWTVKAALAHGHDLWINKDTGVREPRLGQWRTEDRKITFWPSTRWPKNLHDPRPPIEFMPPARGSVYQSQPFVVRS